jgi:putative chitinase
LGIPKARAEFWTDPLNAAFERFEITEPICIAAFLAQVGHESAKLTALEENLNYSANGLLSVFPKYFDHDSALEYARKRKAIASRVYANRMGNGDEASGDGWKYRGKGLIQVTGKENHAKCGEALGLPLIDNPDLLLEPVNAALSAAWYWDSRKLNNLAHRDDVRGLTKAINGGMIGFADRQLLHQLAKKALGV